MACSELSLLRAENAGFAFDGGRGVENISLELKPGEFLGIAGPNGSGKSTLLGLLSGRLKPQRGDIFLLGKHPHLIAGAERARAIGALPAESEFNPRYTVLETVLMGRMLSASWWRDPSEKDRRAAADALRVMALDGMENRAIGALSSGERQRVFLAQALCSGPRILLLDEPASHLDLKRSLELLRLLRESADRGLAVAAVLHDLNAMRTHCDKALLLKHGRLLAYGKAEQALTAEQVSAAFGLEARAGADGTITCRLAGPAQA